MRSIAKSLVRNEKGQAMVMILFLILVGGLIVASLLSYVGTGLLNGRVYERRTAELYAADAGVEDAIWKIQSGRVALCAGNRTHSYEIADINGRMVDITIEYQDDGTYKITSTAATDGGGGVAALPSSTAVEAYLDVDYMDFSALLDNAIVSYDTITIQPNNVVEGDVWLPTADEEHLVNKGTINGTVKDEQDVSITWPSAGQLSAYYWEDVKHLQAEAYPDGYVINIGGKTEEDPYVIGPLLAAGDLTIKGEGWIRLDGTVYVMGSLFVNPTPEIHLDLGGHTVFAENEIRMNPGNPNATINLHGSGCVIAIHDIYFRPNQDSGGDDFVLVMSLEGTVFFNPGTDFTGCIAGNADVQLQPGNDLAWISPEGQGLDFPMGVGGSDELPPVIGTDIVSWKVIPLAPDQSGG